VVIILTVQRRPRAVEKHLRAISTTDVIHHM
jgi:hypothetical protein